jgi:hypothetical protein
MLLSVLVPACGGSGGSSGGAPPVPSPTTAGQLVPAFGAGWARDPSGASLNEGRAIAVDSSFVYVAGRDYIGVGWRWRVEKRDRTTGALVAGFGSGGVVTSALPNDQGEPHDIAVDGTHLFVVGSQDADASWRIEKRSIVDGSLDPAFGTGGVITLDDAGTYADEATAIVLDGASLYVAGRFVDALSNTIWRIDKRAKTDGSPDPTFSYVSTAFGGARALARDATHLYVGGEQSRFEKVDAITGALDPAFGAGGGVTIDTSPYLSSVMSIGLDATHAYVLSQVTAGWWRVDKLALADAAPDPAFGGGTGTIDTQFAGSSEQGSAVAVSGGAIFLAERDGAFASNPRWIIKKFAASDGAPEGAAGAGDLLALDAGDAFDILVDGTAVFVTGKDPAGMVTQKLLASDGTPDVAFGPSGVVESSGPTDTVLALAIDGDDLYIGLGSPGRIEKRNRLTGARDPVWPSAVSTPGPAAIVVTGGTVYVIGGSPPGLSRYAADTGFFQGASFAPVGGLPTGGATDGTFMYAVASSGVLRFSMSTGLHDPLWGASGGLDVAVEGGYVFVAGFEVVSGGDFQWRLLKADTVTGASAPGFGLAGVETSDPSTGNDQPRALAVGGGCVYVCGFDEANVSRRWRIEKRSAATGILDGAFGSGGVVTMDPGPGDDEATEILLDGAHLYVAGFFSTPGNRAWRIERRIAATGALDGAFGTDGVIVSDPAPDVDEPRVLAADASGICVGGVSEGPPSTLRGRIEKRSK